MKITRRKLRRILLEETTQLLLREQSESVVPDLERRLEMIDSQVKKKGDYVILKADALGGLKEILRMINNSARVK